MTDTNSTRNSDIPVESIDRQIGDVLHLVKYPANKDALVNAARDAGASNEVLAMLDGSPRAGLLRH